MNPQTKTPLLILNASAGSGKTYNLVFQYLKILLANDFSYQNFRHILAMTFTNKAANEMKERVLEALDNMSRSTLSEPVEDAISIFEKLESELDIDRATIIERSQKALVSLLHNYEDFHVMTIDKFNLKLIRNFSRDLDIPGQFEIEMNTDLMIDRLVDNLLNKIGEKDLNELTELIFSFSKSNLDDGEKWDVKSTLVEFAKLLTKESVIGEVGKIINKNYSTSIFNEWNSRRKELNKLLRKKALFTYSICISSGMDVSRTPKKSTSFNQIIKLPEVHSFFNKQPITNDCAKNLLAEPKKGNFVPIEFQKALQDYLDFYEHNYAEFHYIDLLVKNFHSMALLKFMSQFLEELKTQEQIIQISEFNKLISSLIQQSNAPYIYERIGTKFYHYLLDEFQDTSRMQWLNMIPLIEESISYRHQNFIVGDPKQSIYRFRNGVAEQFVMLPRIYNPEKYEELEEISDKFQSEGKVSDLKENRRSARQVVQFNNAFFNQLKLVLSEDSQKFYSSVKQTPTSKSEGFVHIESSKGKIDLETIVNKIIEIIHKCDEAKYKRGDICILGNRNKDLNSIAVELLQHNIAVVSSDSLFVNNDPRVRLTISFLKRRLDPKSKTEMKKFADLFFRMRSDKTQEDYWKYFKEKSISAKTIRFFDDQEFITHNFGNSANFYFQYETIYGLLLKFYQLMGWQEEKNAFLHHLADVVFQYEQTHSSDLRGFLDYYQKENQNMSVLLPESENSVKLMTIHKSKGLEFPVVILPKLDFSTGIHNNAKFLVEVDNNIVYTKLKKDHSIKEIRELHTKESNQIITDKVNLCYVAFTRARERLYGFNYFKSSSLGSIIHEKLSQLEYGSKHDVITVEIGIEEENPKANKEKIKSDYFEPKIIGDKLWFPDIAIRQDELLNELSEEQKFGNAFHLLMANCDRFEDIDEKLEELINQDMLSSTFRKKLKEKANTTFEKLEKAHVLSNSSVIMNEKSIIISEDSIKRPDKIILKEKETIVLDFKTGAEKSNDKKQLQEYSEYLRKMDLPNVKAYLYYSLTEELKEIPC